MVRGLVLLGAVGSLLAACAQPVCGNCGPGAFAPVGASADTLFVANKRGNSLSQIDLASGEEVRRVEACANPHEMAPSPDGQFVAVACYGGRSVAIFEAGDLTRVRDLMLGEGARPHGIEWHANGDIYVTAEGRQSIYHIRNPLGSAPEKFEYPTGQEGTHMLAVSPDARHAWTMDLGSGTVTLVDLADERAPRSLAIGEEPEGIDLSPDGEALWVSARGSNKAYELDPATLELRNTIDVGRFALRLAIRPQGDVAVTSNLADASLSVIDLDTAQVIRTIAVDEPDAAQTRFQVTILWSPDGQRIYVAETGTDTVAEVDYESGRVLRRIATGEGGDGLAIVKRRPAQ